MKYSCKTCNGVVEDVNYISGVDGYMITHGCWFYCDTCNNYSQKVNVE